jgi:hypothetical protein
MHSQNSSVSVAAWWCLVAAGIAAWGVMLGDLPFTTRAALLLLTIVCMPAAVMLGLRREAPAATLARRSFGSDRDSRRHSRELPTSSR